MSSLRNVESVMNPKQNQQNQQGFKPSVQRDGPITEGGHQPGRKVAPQDNVPEFHAKAFPPGTAPASSSYRSHASDIPGQNFNPAVERGHGKESTKTTAGDTLMGSTTQDVHRGFGQPISGQTSAELRHGGQHHRKNPGGGLEGVGASMGPQMERDNPRQRGYEKEQLSSGQRGDKGALAAEERDPEPSETLSKEWNYESRTHREYTNRQ